MNPLMSNFGTRNGLGKKRKRPERDIIDEMLEDGENEDITNRKRTKLHETPSDLIENTKAAERVSSTKKSQPLPMNSDISKKTGKLIVQVYEVLDKPAFDIFRKVMKKVNKKVYTHADNIINDILIAFFNSSIGVADINSSVAPGQVPLYSERKDLSTELTLYMPRDIRPKYKEILSNFYTKYESFHPLTGKAGKKIVQPKPKEIISKIDEIAQRRADIKKMKKRQEIDDKLKMKAPDSLEEGKDSGKETDGGKFCMVCYKADNLYAAKCGHYACKTCWDSWLEKYLECPTCRNRTRKNQIVPLSQEGIFQN